MPAPPTPSWESEFDELLELDAAGRDGRLAALRASDPELARFLGELVAADAAAGQDERTFEMPIAVRHGEFVARALDLGEAHAAPGNRSGERIDAWRLVRPLGRGGMAEVYLAERVDGEFEQRAALKLVRTEVGSQSIHRRFLRERRILAQLDHPGIARLLDGGRTAAGEPYFVLELVEGRRITEHCEAARLPIAARLRLFAEACDAVDAAHRRLVVHRDLKPSNILVTATGQVKLLDFGIAKLLDPGGEVGTGAGGGTTIPAGSGPMTRLEAQPLTPSYAAPEQILGEPISTATDVFALGILLYELLTGRPPFDRRSDSRGALAIEVAAETLTAASVALRRRAGEPEERELFRLRAAELEGDLDTVIGKALAREPERRYRSAAALAEDVRNYLARRPVRARPDSFVYRASRFVQRHRAAVAVAAAAGLALVGLVAFALVQGVDARRQARRAERVRDFLVELFREADPSRTRGESLTAREMVAVGAARVDRELDDEPAVAAELGDAIAQVELSLGMGPEAAARARGAIRRFELAEGVDSRGARAAQVTLAEALFATGDLDGTADAVAAARPLLDSRVDEDLAERLLAVETNLLSQLGRFEGSVELARKTLARVERTRGAGSSEALVWRTRLAGLVADASKVGEAVEILRPALPLLAAEADGNPLRLAESRLLAGEILEVAGERAEGEKLLESAVELLRATLGPDHPEVALAEIKLGFLRYDRRRYEAAKATLEHAVAVLDRIHHYEAGAARRYLGFVRLDLGDFAGALRDFELAEQIFRERGAGGETYLNAARVSQGLALLRLGELGRAEALLRDVAAALERSEGASGSSHRTALKYLGETRRRRGDPAEALALHRRARELEVEIFGDEEHTAVAVSDFQLALDLLAAGDPASRAEARARVDHAIAVQRADDPTHPRLGDFLVASARVARAEGDAGRAAADAGEGLALLRASRPKGHPSLREAEEVAAVSSR